MNLALASVLKTYDVPFPSTTIRSTGSGWPLAVITPVASPALLDRSRYAVAVPPAVTGTVTCAPVGFAPCMSARGYVPPGRFGKLKEPVPSTLAAIPAPACTVNAPSPAVACAGTGAPLKSTYPWMAPVSKAFAKPEQQHNVPMIAKQSALPTWN